MLKSVKEPFKKKVLNEKDTLEEEKTSNKGRSSNLSEEKDGN